MVYETPLRQFVDSSNSAAISIRTGLESAYCSCAVIVVSRVVERLVIRPSGQAKAYKDCSSPGANVRVCQLQSEGNLQSSYVPEFYRGNKRTFIGKERSLPAPRIRVGFHNAHLCIR